MELSEIINGVVTGLVLAIALASYDLVKNHLSKREQINYIRALILDGYHRVHNAENDETERLYYVLFIRHLESAISTRSARLSYDEKRQILILMPYSSDGLIALPPAGVPMPTGLVETTFEQFKEVPWLRLPASF